MIAKLPFGSSTCAVDLRGLRVRSLTGRPTAAAGDPSLLVARAVDAPLSGPPLEALARRSRSAVVIVPDGTRRAALPEILPVFLDRVLDGGVMPEAVLVLVACGTHPPSDAAALRELLGELPPGVRAEQHDSRDPTRLVPAGRVPSTGLEVRLHRAVLEAELLITVGPVRHHYFAGFGGGPKLVFPGVAGYEEIQRNHSRVLDLDPAPPRRHPGCEPGRRSGNPVAEEIAAAAGLRPPDLGVCLVNAPGGMAWAGAGPGQTAYEEAVRMVRRWYEVPAETFGLAVASAGGAPSDATLIQAHKALDAICRFVSPGGEVLLVAELGSGSGSPEMQPFLDDPSPEAIMSSLGRRWVQYGHTALRIVEKTRRYRVSLVSRFDSATAARLGFEPVGDAASVLGRWREDRPGETVAVLAGDPVYPAAAGP